MSNLSRRLTKASEESTRATQRIAAAEGRIMHSLIELIDTEPDAAERPTKNVTPPRATKTETDDHGRKR